MRLKSVEVPGTADTAPGKLIARTSVWRILAASILGALGIFYFYRGFFTSGFTMLQSNSGDGALTPP